LKRGKNIILLTG